MSDGLRPHQEVSVSVRDEQGSERRFKAVVRLDGEIDVRYFTNGGVLQTVLRRLASADS